MGTTGLRSTVAVTGIGESDFHRGGGNETRDLVLTACERAIADAGLTAGDVQGIVTEEELMPDVCSPTWLAETLGLGTDYLAQTLSIGAGIAAAPLYAAQAVATGMVDHVLCYFGIDWASQLEAAGAERGGPYSFHTEYPEKANLEVPFGWVTQPVYLAGAARRHMHEHGTTKADLGEVAIQTRENATETENAQMREPLTMDAYHESPVIADPFSVLDCCLISDGAGAFVLSAADAAEETTTNPVYVRGVGTQVERSETTHMSQRADLTSLPVEKAGQDAYEMAGVAPDDVDFAELYDCFTITTLMQLEGLGFCADGDGGRFVREDGITVEEGSLPVNTHGGLLSGAYLLGVNHVVEAVRQIRGTADNQVPDAETGVVGLWGDTEYAALVLGDQP